MLRLIALVLPLALDTFAISAALGLVGIGSVFGPALGSVGSYLAIATLAGLGIYMLFADEEKEEARVARFAAASGAGLLVVGLSVSLDELAIGFVLGLAIGHRVGESVREGAERLAGVALIVLAGLFLLARFVQLPA